MIKKLKLFIKNIKINNFLAKKHIPKNVRCFVIDLLNNFKEIDPSLIEYNSKDGHLTIYINWTLKERFDNYGMYCSVVENDRKSDYIEFIRKYSGSFYASSGIHPTSLENKIMSHIFTHRLAILKG